MLNTGFSEITEERAKHTGDGFWYCELALTGACNFNCKYCNKFSAEIDVDVICKFIESEKQSLHHIQLTGGEPTQSPYLSHICKFIKDRDIKLGISTNGSADLAYYVSLNVDMFSISLDDYNVAILEIRGYKKVHKIIENIKRLSKLTYVNIGVVIDSMNCDRIELIVKYILSLGVHDIKLSISTHDEVKPVFSDFDYSKYPILNYRVNRFRRGLNMRGINDDIIKCEIARSDISIVGTKHYPCLIYARESGEAIGDMTGDIKTDRSRWYKNHVPKLDPICKRYCMDFKCDFNRIAGLEKV